MWEEGIGVFEGETRFPASELAEASEKQAEVQISRRQVSKPGAPSCIWASGSTGSRAVLQVALWASDQRGPLLASLSLAPAVDIPVANAPSLPPSFFLPGLTETLSTQPWAEDTIRQKGEGSTPSSVSVVEAGPRADFGSRLCASGGELREPEPGQAQVRFLHLPVLQLPEPLLHLAEAYLWLPVPPGY